MLEFQTLEQRAQIISEGTLRSQDLIPAFLDAVAEHAPEHYAAMTVAPFGPIPSYVQDEGDKSEWWTSDDASVLLEDLQDILFCHTPDGYTFGTQEGDGACFGFWPHGPQDDDYVVWQEGSCWIWTVIAKRHKEDYTANTEHNCCLAIQEYMTCQKHWPNIWLDHGERGNYSLVVIKEV